MKSRRYDICLLFLNSLSPRLFTSNKIKKEIQILFFSEEIEFCHLKVMRRDKEAFVIIIQGSEVVRMIQIALQFPKFLGFPLSDIYIFSTCI